MARRVPLKGGGCPGSGWLVLQTTFITVDKPENPFSLGGMSMESESNEGGEAAVAPGNPLVARRVPLKGRRLPRACAPEGCDGYYHVVSRINGRARVLTDTRREGFRELLGRVVGFCGVEVLTYCFMENHFHLLVRVPGEVGEIDDEELLRRAALLYGAPPSRGRQPLSLAGIRGALERGTAEEREAMRSLLIGRMGSLPMFVKILKQRFSLRYNREHGRLGTLWEGPFRSVLVEPTHRALSVVGAYIDLNPVRAGIVEDPKDYRFSGYGEAVELEKAWAVEREGGKLSLAELLRCRVRCLTDGAVIGGKAWMEVWLRANPETYGRRKTPPKAMRGGVWGGLCSLRDLMKGVIG